MSEEKDTKKTIEDLKASVFKRIDSIKENEKQISSSDTFEISDAEDHTPKQKDKSYKQRITKIYGPPGTGKTTKLINLVKDFIAKGVNPNEIGFFAFTNHSTEVAKGRITQAFPNLKLETDFSGFRTIHSMAYTTFQKSPNLLTEEQALDFNDKFTIEKPMMETDNPSSVVVRAKHPVLDVASVARSKLITFEEYLKNLSARDIYYLKKFLGYSYKNCIPPISKEDIEALIKFNQAYELYKSHLNVIDYTSILEKALEQDKSIPEYEVVFVDEAQDLSKLQWRVVEKVFKKSQNIYIAGDDDQAICENMGASADTFINYKFDDEIILDQSYRVPPKVHQNLFGVDNIIGTLTKFFTNRKEKNWKPKVETQEGSFLKLSKQTFLDLVVRYPNKDWLIMATTHQTLEKYSQLLKDFKVSHILSNKVIIANQNDIKKLPSIKLKTIWSAKGSEADCTALIRDNSFIDEDMMQQDPRLVYVAQTRTKCLHFEVSEKYFSDVVNLGSHFQNLQDIYKERKDNDTVINEGQIVNKSQNIEKFATPIKSEIDITGPLNTSQESQNFLKASLLKIVDEKNLYHMDMENLEKYLSEQFRNIISTRVISDMKPNTLEYHQINRRLQIVSKMKRMIVASVIKDVELKKNIVSNKKNEEFDHEILFKQFKKEYMEKHSIIPPKGIGRIVHGAYEDVFALREVLIKFMERENFSTNDLDELTRYFVGKLTLIKKDYIYQSHGNKMGADIGETFGFARNLASDEINKKTENLKKELNTINSTEIVSEVYMRNSSILKDLRLTKRGSKDCIELIMEDGTRRARNFGDLNKIFSVVSKLKRWRIYNDVANPTRNSDYEWFLNINIDERKPIVTKDEEDIPF